MNAFKRFAVGRPVLFGLVVSISVLVCYVATAFLAEAVTESRAGYEFAEAIGRAAASLLFVLVLWRFGWLGASGVSKAGTLSAWATALVVLAYDLVTTAYALFGSVAVPGVSDPVLSASVAANALTTGLIEEVPFRGVVLCALVRAWGDSRRGAVKAALYSSLLFGAIHVIHILLGRPVVPALLVALSAFLSGMFYAGIVLRWRTIWTVVMLHGVGNAAVAMRVIATAGFSEGASALGLTILFQLPLAVYGAYLVCRMRRYGDRFPTESQSA